MPLGPFWVLGFADSVSWPPGDLVSPAAMIGLSLCQSTRSAFGKVDHAMPMGYRQSNAVIKRILEGLRTKEAKPG